VPFLAPPQQAFFDAVIYSTTAVVASRARHTKSSAARSVAYARQTGRAIGALTIATDLSATADAIKQYGSGEHGADLCAQTDEVIRERLGQTAPFVLPTPADIEDWRLQRWPEAIPRFDTGHFQRLRQFEDGQIEADGQALVFAGDYLGGPFIEGAFTSGLRAAERLDRRLRN
jgi:oxygen-dependent protoporphyrinogen oxidase